MTYNLIYKDCYKRISATYLFSAEDYPKFNKIMTMTTIHNIETLPCCPSSMVC